MATRILAHSDTQKRIFDIIKTILASMIYNEHEAKYKPELLLTADKCISYTLSYSNIFEIVNKKIGRVIKTMSIRC